MRKTNIKFILQHNYFTFDAKMIVWPSIIKYQKECSLIMCNLPVQGMRPVITNPKRTTLNVGDIVRLGAASITNETETASEKRDIYAVLMQLQINILTE